MKKYNALIIGAGNIGAFFDNPASKYTLTHAHAYCAHNGFLLTGFVNTIYTKAQEAVRKWGGKAYSTTEEAIKSQQIDVVSVAVPDASHYKMLKQLAHYPIKLVFAEKPLTTSLSEANEIVSLYKKINISLAVNYTRRFVPELRTLKEMIASNKFGEYVSGSGIYGKGLIHNGSHMIDLLRFFFEEVEISSRFSKVNDYTQNDPSVSALLTINKEKNFYLQAIDSKLYSIFELDLFFEKKRVRIINSGSLIEVYDVAESKMFKGYTLLVKTESLKTSLPQALSFAIENVYGHLKNGIPLLCTGEDARKTLEVCLQ